MELTYSSSQPSSSQSSSISSTSSSSIQDVNQILYLLDRFGISDQFYHELSMLHKELPRSYEVKKARAAITLNVELRRLPRPYFGCYRPLKQCLIDAISAEVNVHIGIIKIHISSRDIHLHSHCLQVDEITTITSPIEVKIGGDGAPFSRTSSYILLSFSLPTLQKKLSSEGNKTLTKSVESIDFLIAGVYTFAALRGIEEYSLLKNGFAPVIEEINFLLNNRYLKIFLFPQSHYNQTDSLM